MLRQLVAVFVAGVLAVGCADSSDDTGSDSNDVTTAFGAVDPDVRKDPSAMPGDVLDYIDQQGWLDHHIEWHSVRQWDAFPQYQHEWKAQHWARADVQEGQTGNGLEFLAMHRVMIRKMIAKFPQHADLFAGFAQPPTACSSSTDPCGDQQGFGGKMDPNMAKAIDTMMNHLDTFKSDDDFGLYVETARRWSKSQPNGKATDASAGVHNYLHVRFGLEKSPVTMLDPSKNLNNRHFWRLHGWIESRWTAFRKLKGLTEQDPAYLAAIAKAEQMFETSMKAMPGEVPPPPLSDDARHIFQH